MLKDRLSGPDLDLTAKEEKIRRTLLTNYPVAGLSTVADLATAAGVSVPTVLRFVTKLGFQGYASFQKDLIDELGDTLNSPLSLFTPADATDGNSTFQRTIRSMRAALERLEADYDDSTFESVVDLIADERSEIHCIGGRFSTVLAERLALHLAQVRPRVRLLSCGSKQLADGLVDYDSQVTLVVFDFRRYQVETEQYARMAHERRARIVLFTDRWQSPIASFASKVLTSPVESGGMFDSWVPAIAQTEALVAAVAERHPDRIRERLSAIEAMRDRFTQLPEPNT
ncbi:MurR/RpiR family transcriptional regulator [Litoreibacter albidus]|uniref:Transcriptional regulator, RpiR family n=1 Tax=Litoreibacter albidus TaxID=670155 RepID=A0A1H3CRB2_9RHOB|nr:MurR/RpiR family transcriptional regulator [Litoreibacter albidus]SDX56683.1 transcriptional regulator, RpiR family [Litoreibacter albidus]